MRQAVWRLRRARVMRRAVERTGFASFGAGAQIALPFEVLSPHRIQIGRDVSIRRNAWFSVVDDGGEGPMLSIGDRAELGADIVIACAGRVEIGDAVLIADRVFVGDTYHEYRNLGSAILDQGLVPPRPVRIGDGAFLGIGAIVLPGVTIGENACVGAGAVVTRDVPARSVVIGNPACLMARWDPVEGVWVSVRA